MSIGGGDGTVEDCSVVVDTTGTGLSLGGFSGAVTGCDVTVEDSLGVNLDSFAGTMAECSISVLGGTSTNVGITSGSTSPTVADCFVTAPNGTGITGTAASVTRCTIHNVYTGVSYATVSHSIVSDADLGFVGGPYSYCISPGATGFIGGAQGTGSKNEDPLHCDDSGGEFTLRIDSWGNPENNGSGRIGAFPVACAYGELVRSTVVGDDTQVSVLDDVTVPSAKSLALNPGVQVEFDGDFDLFVVGSLTVDGDPGDSVSFLSGDGSPAAGDWGFIDIQDGAWATVEYAVVRHGTEGLQYESAETGYIRNSRFADNETFNIVVGGFSAENDLEVSGNVIAVGDGGQGIYVDGTYVDGTVIDGNTITGTSLASVGLVLGNAGETPSVTGNTISGFLAGAGISSGGDATFTGNTITGGKWGFYVYGGTPLIGTSSPGSDNVIEENTTGILVLGSGSDPIVRNNQITNHNEFGVQIKSGANPSLGESSGDKGNNTITESDSWCIWNRNTSGTINALYNYFGPCSGEVPPVCHEGSVDATEGLCTAPSSLVNPDVVLMGPPEGFRILGVFPNPMLDAGEIRFSLAEGIARFDLALFDLSGRLVRDLGAYEVVPGSHHVHWDGRSESGHEVPTGVYFVRVIGSGISETSKVLVRR